MQKTSDFLGQLFGTVRGKVLRLLILNDTEAFTATDMARRAGITAPAAESEMRALVKIGVAQEKNGEGKTANARKQAVSYVYAADSKQANALSAFVHEVSPEQFSDVEKALRSAGRFTTIVLSGVFIGDANRPADIIVVGDFVNEQRLEKAVRSFEPKYGREIRYALFSTPEFRYRLTIHDKLLRDTLDYPHRLLLNKKNLV